MMKKYIAPEMELVKFSAQDIITVSGGAGEAAQIQVAGDGSYTFDSTAAVYGEF